MLGKKLRWLFLALVILCAVASLVAGALAAVPGKVPDWALRSALVYRLEIALAAFMGLYVIVVSVRLAQQGRAFTRLSAGAVSLEAEQLAVATDSSLEALEETRTAASEIADVVSVGLDRLAGLEARVADISNYIAPEGLDETDSKILRNLTREVRIIHDRIDALENRPNASEVPGGASDG